MAEFQNSPGYEVDQRVSIALDALDADQRRAIHADILDRTQFLKSTADERKVRRISRDEPLYTLDGPDGLRIIFFKEGDTIKVMDLMRQVTLDQFRGGASRPKISG